MSLSEKHIENTYSGLSKTQLVSACKEKGIRGYSGKTKSQLISLLQTASCSTTADEKPSGHETCETEIGDGSQKDVDHEEDKKAVDREEDKTSVTKPFLKWVGGKTQILHDILSRFPSKMENYHEPFVGGGSVLLGLLSYIRHGIIHVSGTIYASDINSNLISLYKTIQTTPQDLIREVRIIDDQFSSCQKTAIHRRPATLTEARTSPESYYFWIRNTFNSLSVEEKKTPKASAMLLFLNKTCFRGVYREGPHGFNVPFGNYRHPCILDEEHILEVSSLLQNVVLTSCSFTDSLGRVKEGDFVYMDPPYAPQSETSFVSYTAEGFTLEKHILLFQLCRSLITKGVSFVMSNADVKIVRESFPSPPYSTTVISCRRAIHSKKPDSKTNEVIIESTTQNH